MDTRAAMQPTRAISISKPVVRPVKQGRTRSVPARASQDDEVLDRRFLRRPGLKLKWPFTIPMGKYENGVLSLDIRAYITYIAHSSRATFDMELRRSLC